VKHWRYLKYVLRHKWYVFLYGCQLGIPLLALLHDNSKFRPSEWFAYVEFFYGGPKRLWAEVTGYEKTHYFDSARRNSKEGVKEAFDYAWLHHQKRNKHHWQYWVLTNDEEGQRALFMPDRYRREMLADWKGAGRAINGVEDALGWYGKNRDKMTLHPETRAWIEQELSYLREPVSIDREAFLSA
jgi:hypothetical protein